MRDRHWSELLALAGQTLDITMEMPLRSIEQLQLWNIQGSVEEITDKSTADTITTQNRHTSSDMACISKYSPPHIHKNWRQLPPTFRYHVRPNVRGGCTQAKQEAVMEKTLNMLESTWSVARFEEEQHKETDVVLLNTTEEQFELLEDHLVQCQNMITSR
ncbi:UNVERIFIED_CONTAM: hypothetical protein H355_008668 [Colinus virginianus]|nr:hypothetical protein H355_008668 [Colinus virginianus]